MSLVALSIGIGPVGSFIAAGRRSRDLWWGSRWLAECTAEVASNLLEEGSRRGFVVELMLPSQQRLVALRSASPLPGGARRDFGGRVANHVRALLVGASAELLPLLLAAIEAHAHAWLAERVQGCWDRARRRIADETHRNKGTAFSLDDVLDEEQFRRQVEAIRGGDFIRLAAGWCVVPSENESDDDTSRGHGLRRADEVLEMARRSRAFPAASWSRAGSRKSDLDPGRDGILIQHPVPERRAAAARSRAALGIRSGEQLDAIGFARRIAAFDDAPGPAGHPELGRLPFLLALMKNRVDLALAGWRSSAQLGGRRAPPPGPEAGLTWREADARPFGPRPRGGDRTVHRWR